MAVGGKGSEAQHGRTCESACVCVSPSMCVCVCECVCWGCSHGIEALVTECAVTCKLFWRLLRPCTLECDARAKVRLHSHVESEGAGVRERQEEDINV